MIYMSMLRESWKTFPVSDIKCLTQTYTKTSQHELNT